MTTQAELYRRAGALCIAAEPHSEITDWPCRTHLDEARRQLSAPASSAPSEAPRPLAGVDDGAAGVQSACVGGSTLNDNRPGTLNPEAAEGATAIARLEGTR